MKTTLLWAPRRAALALLFAGALGATALTAPGCSLFEVADRADPNGPSLEDVLANPTTARLANLAVGVEASSRVDLELYLIDVGVIGREYWRTSSADPRFTADLLGKSGSVLDDNTFYTTRPWAARYRTIRNANTLLLGIDANTTLSAADKAAGRGFARTWAAYQYLLNLNLTFDFGVRFIDPGADEAGPVLGSAASLAEIASILDAGAADLAAGGSAFFFPVSTGFAGLNTPATFRQFNRALAVRVAVYSGQYANALAILNTPNETFIDPAGDLTFGAYHVYSSSSGDLVNLFFIPPTNAYTNALVAHPSYVTDLEAGDNRIAKVFDRGVAETFDGLTSQFTLNRYPANTTPVPIVRNAELLLLRAEARWFTGDHPGATADLNTIRASSGLLPVAVPATDAAFTDQLLSQRRYELYAEGHRWVDVRRFGRLSTLPIDRVGDDVWSTFPIPEAEGV